MRTSAEDQVKQQRGRFKTQVPPSRVHTPRGLSHDASHAKGGTPRYGAHERGSDWTTSHGRPPPSTEGHHRGGTGDPPSSNILGIACRFLLELDDPAGGGGYPPGPLGLKDDRKQ